MKPNIKTLPCFKQVADVIGVKQATLELWKVVHCDSVRFNKMEKIWISVCKSICLAIPRNPPQGKIFWDLVYLGINPYTGEKV